MNFNSYSEANDLTGVAMATYSITAASINGNGMIDIIVGNDVPNIQLLLYYSYHNIPIGYYNTVNNIGSIVECTYIVP